MRLVLLLCGSVALVSACAIAPDPAPKAPVQSAEDVQRPVSRPNVAPEDSAVATPQPQAAGALGVTIASLGNPGEPGLWLKTPLVQQESAGRVHYAATGKSVAVTLIPIGGPATAGSRMSLGAMQAVGAPLAGLPEVEVFLGG